MNETCHIYDSYICVTDSFICMTWLIHTCHMTHAHVWHESVICVPWRIHMCHMAHIYLCRDSFIRVTFKYARWTFAHAIFTPTSTHTQAHTHAHTHREKWAHTQIDMHPQACWHFWFSKMKHSAQSSTTTHTHCACSVQHQKCACAFKFISAYVFCAFVWCLFVWTQAHFGLKAPRLRWPSLLISVHQWNSRRSARASRPSNSAMCVA